LPDLAQEARAFASMIQRLLNTTICDGPTITAIVHPSRPEVYVGHGLTKTSLESQRFRVRRRNGKTWCWLNLSFRLCLDDEQKYLTVRSSFIGVYAENNDPSCICHFDYERDKADYPEAHLQVFGNSPSLEQVSTQAQERGLHRLHFPVGGRRYRPCLEDVIEFLIAERLAPGRPGWQEVVREGREDFRRMQLRAAIRNDALTARQMLAELDQAEAKTRQLAKVPKARSASVSRSRPH
jgi:hypothetical protein